jgi:hypothetical protein
LSINTTDQNTDPSAVVNTNFNIYAIDNSNPSAHAFGNVKFVAPPGSVIHINTDVQYHTLIYASNDGANRARSDYGHYFTITDKDGNIIATGVLDGINFNTATIGVNPRFPNSE